MCDCNIDIEERGARLANSSLDLQITNETTWQKASRPASPSVSDPKQLTKQQCYITAPGGSGR